MLLLLPILLINKSAVAPKIPPIVNSSNALSPIGNSSLYKPTAVKSCATPANISWNASAVPVAAADFNLVVSSSCTVGFFNAFLGMLLNNLSIGANSLMPITPPVSMANFSAIAFGCSPNALDSSSKPTCSPIPIGTAKAPGTPKRPTLSLTIPLDASFLPANAAPPKPIKEPAPSANLVPNVPLNLGLDDKADSVAT